MVRIRGEFSPPRELVAIAASRMAGRGSIEVSGAGLVFEGAIHGASPAVPIWALPALALAGLAVSALVPHAERILAPATALLVCGIFWLRYQAEYGRTGAFRVSWPEVEHVVRLASAPDVLAFVLSRPIDGGRTPEQVFFSAADGLDALVAALRAEAPERLTIDVVSALLPPPEGSVEQPDPR